jgi:hypothetical protein
MYFLYAFKLTFYLACLLWSGVTLLAREPVTLMVTRDASRDITPQPGASAKV